MGTNEGSLNIFLKPSRTLTTQPVMTARPINLNPTASVSHLKDVLKVWQEVRDRELEAAGPSPTDTVARQVRYASRMATRQQKILDKPSRAPTRKLLETIAKVAEADEKKGRLNPTKTSATRGSSAGPSQSAASLKRFATSSTDECTPFTSTQTMLKFKMSKKERKRSPKSSAGAPIKPSSTSHSQDQKTTDSSAVTVKNLPIKEEEDLSFPCHFSKGSLDRAGASFSDPFHMDEDSMDSEGDFTSRRQPGPSHSVIRLGSETPVLTARNGCMNAKTFSSPVAFTPGERRVAVEFQLLILRNFFASRELRQSTIQSGALNANAIPSSLLDTPAIEGYVTGSLFCENPENFLSKSENIFLSDSGPMENEAPAPRSTEVRPVSPTVIESIDEERTEFEIPKLPLLPCSTISLQKSVFDLMLEKLMSASATQEDLLNLASVDWLSLRESTWRKFENDLEVDSETEDDGSIADFTDTIEEVDGFLQNLFQKTDEIVRKQSQQQAEETAKLPVARMPIRPKKAAKDVAENSADIDQLFQMADELPSETESSSGQSEDNVHEDFSADLGSDPDNSNYEEAFSGIEESENDDENEDDDEDDEEVRKWIEDTFAQQPSEESAVARKPKTPRRQVFSSDSSQMGDEEDSETDSSTGDSAIVRDSIEKAAFARNGGKFNDADLDARLAELLPHQPEETVRQSGPSGSDSYDDEPADPNQPSTSAGLSGKKKRRKTKKRKTFSFDSGLSSKSPDRTAGKKVKFSSLASKRDRASDSDSVHSPKKKRIKREFDSDSELDGSESVEKPREAFEVITISDSSEAVASTDESDRSGKLFDLGKLNAAEAKKKKFSPKKNLAKNGKVRRSHKIMSDKELSMASRRAVREEADRKDRVEDLPEYEDGLLDRGVTELETIVEVRVHEALWKELRPHQREGVRFLYRNVVETYEHIQIHNAEYTGCILAHSMGLGKTLQVIAFLQAVFSCDELNVKTCLVLCPASVVLNWNNECRHWMRMIPRDCRFQAYVVKSGNIHENISIMRNWKEGGGVLIMSYALYLSYCRTASGGTRLSLSRSLSQAVLDCLRDSGPDFLVCDEAHTLKNAKGKQYQCVAGIATRARIALTGTPLQNNLDEYYTMVNFVKESLLGTHKEFENRFKKPINRGSESQVSTQRDVRLMKERSHILRETLSGCLLLRGSSILADSLPPKLEYQITLRPQPMQIALYKALINYLDARQDDEETPKGQRERKNDMLSCHKTMQLITFHPRCLQHRKEQEKDKIDKAFRKRRQTEIGEDSDDDEDIEDLGDPSVWFENLLPTTSELDWRLGTKTIIVREIILQACAAGDKLLIFADRIPVLAVAEELLLSIHKEKLTTPDGRPICFKANVNYLKLDGQTKMDTRDERIQKFNKDPECTVFLLSIRAAGMGINLVGANRVILVEPTWNPTTDKQALFRTYRYGQTKPVYVYRLTTFGTLEQRVGELQLRKDLLVNRVLEEKHGRRREAAPESFLHFQEDIYNPKNPFIPKDPPKDPLIGSLLQTHPELIYSTANYDSLLEATEPALSHEESVQAWVEYNIEQADDDQWRGGDPFRNLPLPPDQLAKELNKKDGCSFTVEPADVHNLMGFVAAICRKMPRGSKKNLHAILQRLKQDLGKVRTVVQAVYQKREKAAEAQQQRAREQLQVLQGWRAHHQGTLPHPGIVIGGAEFINGMSVEAFHQRHGLSNSDIPRGMPPNPQWRASVAPPLNQARPPRPVMLYPDIRPRLQFLPDPRTPRPLVPSRIVAPFGFGLVTPTQLPFPTNKPALPHVHFQRSSVATPTSLMSQNNGSRSFVPRPQQAPFFNQEIINLDLEDHVTTMWREEEQAQTNAREAEEAVQHLLEREKFPSV